MSASQTFCRSRPPLKKYRPCTVYMRSSITLAPQLHAAKAERVGGLGEEKRWRFSYPNSPEAREIKHTLKYDRLKLPTTFFTDKYGQVQIQTDIYEQQVYPGLQLLQTFSLLIEKKRMALLKKISSISFRFNPAISAACLMLLSPS